jgi:hypothetical protein
MLEIVSQVQALLMKSSGNKHQTDGIETVILKQKIIITNPADSTIRIEGEKKSYV